MIPLQVARGEDGAVPRPARRVIEVDLLRGLAIIGVILVHTSAHFQSILGVSALVVTNVVIDVAAHYAVPLFVILSGFALALRYRSGPGGASWGEFYRQRLKTVVPPYLVFSLLYIGLNAYRHGMLSLREAIIALLTGTASYHLWFVVMLIQLYLLFPLLLLLLGRVADRGRVAWVLLAALLLQWAWNVGTLYMLDALPSTFFFQTLLSYRVLPSHILYFVIGIAIALDWPAFRSRLEQIPVWPAAIAAAVLLLLTAAVWLTSVAWYGRIGDAPQRHFALAMLVEPALYLMLAVLLWNIAGRLAAGPSSAGLLIELGALSFGIYLIHVFFQVLLADLMSRGGVTYADWVFYPVMFAGTLLLSYAAVRLLSRLPFAGYVVGVRR